MSSTITTPITAIIGFLDHKPVPRRQLRTSTMCEGQPGLDVWAAGRDEGIDRRLGGLDRVE
jgi:hypothetical protein